MSSKENSASGFSYWHEVISALDTEIVASQEKKTEISLFDGKRLRDKHNNEDYFYTFVEDIGFVGAKGDINDDGTINVQDVIIAVNYALNNTIPDPGVFWSADMNYDNILNILDVVRIVNFILS